MSERKIEPSLLSGFRDYGPEEMIAREEMILAIRDVYERYGFDPLDTAVIERTDVLTGGREDFEMILFNANLSRGSQESKMSLRFDLTVSLARFVASHPDLPKPFKRYQIGKVYRGEKPQAGRFREFIQFDVDTVGTWSPIADAEIIEVMVAAMRALDVERFVVRFSNRKLLDGLAELAGFSGGKVKNVLRVVDKLEKVGMESVRAELLKQPVNELDRNALGMSKEAADRIERFLSIRGSSDAVLQELRTKLRGATVAEEGIQELETIVRYLRASGVEERFWRIDPSIARGLDYYTGPVFETRLLDFPEIGSVYSGGRYDNLVSRFTNAIVPGTGASIGIDRLFVALEKLGHIKKRRTLCEALILMLDKNLPWEYAAMLKELRSGGIRTNFYLGDEQSFQAQFNVAVSLGIPVVILYGSKEHEANVVGVRDMIRRTQRNVPRAELVGEVKRVLSLGR